MFCGKIFNDTLVQQSSLHSSHILYSSTLKLQQLIEAPYLVHYSGSAFKYCVVYCKRNSWIAYDILDPICFLLEFWHYIVSFFMLHKPNLYFMLFSWSPSYSSQIKKLWWVCQLSTYVQLSIFFLMDIMKKLQRLEYMVFYKFSVLQLLSTLKCIPWRCKTSLFPNNRIGSNKCLILFLNVLASEGKNELPIGISVGL